MMFASTAGISVWMLAALLLDTRPNSPVEAQPFGSRGSGEGPLESETMLDGSGYEESLLRKDSSWGTASGEGDGDELLFPAERSSGWTRALGDEEVEDGSGMDSSALLKEILSTEALPGFKEDPSEKPDLDAHRKAMFEQEKSQAITVTSTAVRQPNQGRTDAANDDAEVENDTEVKVTGESTLVATEGKPSMRNVVVSTTELVMSSVASPAEVTDKVLTSTTAKSSDSTANSTTADAFATTSKSSGLTLTTAASTESESSTVTEPATALTAPTAPTAATPTSAASLIPTDAKLPATLAPSTAATATDTPTSMATPATVGNYTDEQPGNIRKQLSREFCRTNLSCVFHVWASFCVIFLMLLVLRGVYNNGVSALRWCCRLPRNLRRSDTMKGIEFVNIGMDKRSWDNKSACSQRIKAEIEARLRQLFNRCDVTLEMVGSLSSRLGKSLNARPEAEDSLQQYRFTQPVLGADADFMVILQVPVAPMAAGGRELPWHVLEGVAPYMTLSPFTRVSSESGPRLPAAWQLNTSRTDSSLHGDPQEVAGDGDIELQFLPCPDTALSICPVSTTPTPSPQLRIDEAPVGCGDDGFLWPMAARSGLVASSPRTSQTYMSIIGEDDSVSLGGLAERMEPDGEASKIQRSASLNQIPSLQRLPTLETSRGATTPPGFARVQLFLDRVLPEDRRWWRTAMSELSDGVLYLSSKKARHLMREMFDTLKLNVEQDRQSMSIVDSCLADYRGEPSYEKEVTARGPAITLKLTQSDDRAIANMRFFQNSCFYWICLCFSVILLLPFFIWIFLTGGSWPVRKCTGGACCSIYYTVTLLLPMVLVLPVLLLLLTLQRPQKDEHADSLHIWLMVAYITMSAFCASMFVCVSQCFFKLPTIFYGDFVTALVCPQWPRDARRFKNRSRQWPPRSEVDGIVRQGCHLVPKPPVPCRCLDVQGDAPCDEAHLLWRYSFSKAEVRLSKSIPEHYRRAYMTLKWLIKKYVVKSSCPIYGVGSNMRSYYLKTVLFWELDKEGVLEWSEGVEEVLLSRLALRLQQHVRQRHLPHFFIPNINLLDELTQIDFENLDRLMDMVLTDPAPLINVSELKWKLCTIGLCEAIFCTPGRDYRSELCCNYASRLHSIW